MDRRYLYLCLCLVALVTLAVTGSLYYTKSIESQIRQEVQNILNDAKYTSVSVITDGTEVTLSGSVSTITQREKAYRLVSDSNVASFVRNRITVIPAQPGSENMLAMEIQKNNGQLILSGQIPSKVAQLRLKERAEVLGRSAVEVVDLLINRNREGYERFVDAAFAGLETLNKLDHGQVRVDEVNIVVTGEAQTAEQHQAALATLDRLRPDGYTSQFDVDAPLPTISPYIFSISQEDGSYSIQACHAPNETIQTAIQADIAKFTNLEEGVACTLAIGQPDDQWDKAISGGLQALREMSSGFLYIVDNKISLTGFAKENEDPTVVSDRLNQSIPAEYVIKTSIKPWYPLADPYALEIRKRDNAIIRVEGNAPSEDIIEKLFTPFNLATDTTNTITLARGTPENWQIAVDLLLNVTQEIPSVDIIFSNKDVIIKGDINTVIKQRISTSLSRKLPEGYTISFESTDGVKMSFDAITSPHWLEVSKAGTLSDIVLDGRVPDEATLKAVVVYTSSSFIGQRIQDNLSLSNDTSALDKNWFAAVTGMVDILRTLDRGVVTLKNDKITIEGETFEQTGTEDLRAFFKEGVLDGLELDANLSVGAGGVVETKLSSEDCLLALNKVLQENSIEFAPNSFEIEADSQNIILELANTYRQCAPTALEIGGYTDNTGASDLNMELSFNRARSVLEAMVRAGISPSRLTAVGYGEADPIASNETEEGQRKNRRFEFKLKE